MSAGPPLCPGCNQRVDAVFSVATLRPFTASSPQEGLLVWGAYSVPKTVLCHSPEYVHFQFDNLETRLVFLGQKSASSDAPEGGESDDCPDDDCPKCGGTGYSHHECKKECCVEPENNVICDWCEGKG